MKRVQLKIFGDVTGVGYRYWARKNAQNLNLKGFIRNVSNGEVEAVFEGKELFVKKMVELCKKGPEVAWVLNVVENWTDATGEFTDFEVRF